ncbi:RNA polymerase sigma factor [Microcoleus sp. PH2017_05_CCC_O_A]|uniref:RNA polymerase sigma factor n=1 Tax=Microcoleus sp. PH2017_05_CCC_O_A TaxID=2798816 RepID=UPI001D432E82|nr:RNA polymerase sigma factor [Microcoleus sp. PH2017_05_CCC_O_A]MCC3435338.1 RNA polymerase sigma factor [Microcoleus sp. PH2017_05_CCC_O_A]TAG62544.1 MAG: RNA polymerase sigma factor [Oscillatoriales cyanobacterium]
MKLGSQLSSISKQSDRSSDTSTNFWQQWNQHRDYLYRCCLKWMDGNATNAEEVLSRAMLKAFEKSQDSTGVITNFKAWLTRLTYNLCMDIHRENKRLGDRVESLEVIIEKGEEGLVFLSHSPETVALHCELAMIIQRAIEDLPPKLREPFILHFIAEKSYLEIVQKLGVSYENLRKRISQARKILQKRLTKYLSGLDNSLLNSSESPDKKGSPGVESFHSDEIIAIYQKIAPFPQQKGRFDCSLNYQVSAICLETIFPAWYQSPTALGWS